MLYRVAPLVITVTPSTPPLILLGRTAPLHSHLNSLFWESTSQIKYICRQQLSYKAKGRGSVMQKLESYSKYNSK